MTFQQALSALSHTGERRLWLVSGDPEWCLAQLMMLPSEEAIAFSHRSLACQTLRPTQVTHQLGQEYRYVIFDGHSGVHPDMLAASAGLVKAGGLLILLLPAQEQIATFDDPDYCRYVPEVHQQGECHRFFLQRMLRLLRSATGCWRLDQSEGWDGLDLPQGSPWQPSADDLGCLTSSQRQAVESIVHCARGHRHRPLIVTADRGRGKSAALGIAAGHLLRQAHAGARMRILMTAPSQAALATVIRHAEAITQGKWQQDHLALPHAELRFLSPERLINESPEAELLLIDEAAAIPGHQLLALSECYSRLIFATTRHGYEGSGQGFALRIQRRLEQRYAQLTICQLQEPIRWSVADRLEPLIHRLFLLNVDVASPPATPWSEVHHRWVTSAELVENEPLLRQIYGLLVLAHYQTSVSDLRAMLDTPHLQLLLQTIGETVVGVLWLNQEGPLSAALATQVWHGERRVRGQLLPQSLLSHAGIDEAGQYCYGRIMRIAIHPQCQRQGLGTRLLTALQQQATNWDFLGVSFAVSASLLRFWLHAGFRPVRLGLSADAASGEVSAMLLSSGHAERRADLLVWQQRFLEDLPTFASRQLRQLDCNCLAQLLAQGAPTEPSATDHRRLVAVATTHHALDHALPSIQRWLQAHAALLLQLDTQAQQLLIRRVWQGWEWSALQQAGLITGQKAGQTQIRQILAHILTLVQANL
ncbi:tRNA(Met) cytidine acetyltransferase TmcA [Pseudaeromonas sharmana]|uniref:tRNA(Met) cytidine acetyltransferase TmcA n=1 Tax=Pseudaeromonas sharmana TaxID=328412 RepID=A0ABV8CND3_9GAMM